MSSFESLCQHRRSIRQYTAEPVLSEQLDYMLRCALMSPSSKRTNPWEFFLTTDTDKIRPMAQSKTYGSQMFLTATAAIAVAADPALTDTWQADAAIAAEHLLLAAEEQGLGACWCQIYNREDSENKIRELLNIPDNLNVLCVIAIGYKNEERKPYDLQKLLYNKVHRC